MANNIMLAHIKIKGTRPLLWNHFGPETLSLEKKERQGVAGNNPEEWKGTVLVTESKQLYVEPSYAFGCIREGAKYTKKGRGTMQPLVSATMQIKDDKILTNRHLPDVLTTNPNERVYLDIRSVKNPATRGRNVRYRVCTSPGWEAQFSILWDRTIISRAEMEAIVIDAGMFAGIGDGRNIGFGRFVVEEFGAEVDA